jgi:hypothetical protein
VKTVLQGEWEEKRNKIGKTHNLLLIAVLPIAFVAANLVSMVLPRGTPYIVVVFLAVFVGTEGYGIYRIFRYNNDQCRRLGFMCPFCGKPLYEPRALIWNTLCPKCGKSIASTGRGDSSSSSSGSPSGMISSSGL